MKEMKLTTHVRVDRIDFSGAKDAAKAAGIAGRKNPKTGGPGSMVIQFTGSVIEVSDLSKIAQSNMDDATKADLGKRFEQIAQQRGAPAAIKARFADLGYKIIVANTTGTVAGDTEQDDA